MKSTNTVVKQIATFLKEQKLYHAFGVSGANIEHLFHEIASDGELNITLARHESMAGMMAIGSVKAAQAVGVVLTTSGGASFNVIPALAEAYAQSIPLLAFIGQPPELAESNGPFQLSNGSHGTPDIEKTLSGVTRWCKKVKRGDDISQLLAEALEAALGQKGTAGPATLLIPRDIYDEPAMISTIHPVVFTAERPVLPKEIKRPVTLILGSQIGLQKAEDIILCLAEHLQAMAVTSGDARGVFPNNHRLFAGVIGTMGHDSAVEAVRKASTVVVIGSMLPQITQYGITDLLKMKTIYSIGSRELFGIDTFLFLGTDITKTCKELLSLPESQQKTATIPVTYLLNRDNQYFSYARAVQKFINPGENIFIDAGNCGAAMVHYLTAPANSLWDISLSMGGMGYSFGASIGAVLVNKKRTWVFAGDGSFLMHGMEIHTAIEENLPINYIIFDNGSHGMCDLREKKFREPQNFNRFKTTFHGESLGKLFSQLTSFSADSPGELISILDDSEKLSGPLFITAKVDASEPIPFRPLINNEEIK